MSTIKYFAARAPDRMRAVLVGGQVAITVVLLAAAALLAKSFTALQTTDTGFDPDGLVALRLTLPAEFDGHPVERMTLYQRLLNGASAHPAFAAATIVNHLPLTGRGVVTPFLVEGYTDAVRQDGVRPDFARQDGGLVAWLRLPGPAYFETLGIPIVAGRSFDRSDHDTWTGGVLISESFSRQIFGEEDPLGRRVTVFKQASVDPDFGEALVGRIIGVVGDTRSTLRDLQPRPSVYLPLAVHPWPTAMLAVRPRPGAGSVVDALRSVVREVDPRIPTVDVLPLPQLASVFVGRDRFLTVFAGAFSGVAGLLALVGVYSVMSFAVRQRARELGIRAALGATRAQVVRYVLARAGWVVGIGIFVGLIAAIAVTRFMESVLFRTSPLDPLAVGGAALVMALLGIAGASGPARRAAKADPVRALREE